jgi:hypothetical protein
MDFHDIAQRRIQPSINGMCDAGSGSSAIVLEHSTEAFTAFD